MSDWWLIGLLIALALSACLVLIYPLRIEKLSSGLASLILLALTITAYLSWGNLSKWQEFQQKQESQKQAQAMLKQIKSPDELIRKLRAKLDDTPNSAKGWYLLGRLYNTQNNHALAVEAFTKAHQFEPNNEQYTVNYAHALWQGSIVP